MATVDFIADVIFENTEQTYPIGEEICVTYRLRRGFYSGPTDWIGIFPGSWEELDEYVLKQQVQRLNRRSRKARRHLLEIDTSDIQTPRHQDNRTSYMFVYVTQDLDIGGISTEFQLIDRSRQTENYVGNLGQFEIVDMKDPNSSASSQSEAAAVQIDESEELVVIPEQTSPDFTVTPSGTAILNQLDLLIEPTLRAYLENTERALIPVTEEKALLPYVDPLCGMFSPSFYCEPNPSKDNSWLEALAEILGSAPPQTPADDPAEDTPLLLRPKSRACRGCVTKNRHLKTVRSRLRTVKTNRTRLSRELDNLKNDIITKDVLLEDLASHSHTLVQDNAQLTSSNNRLSAHLSQVELRCERQKYHLRIARQRRIQTKRTLQDTCNQVLRYQAEADSAATLLEMTETERDIFNKRVEFLHQELSDTKEQYSKLEEHLDDIMYTLAVLGYTQMADLSGNVMDLTQKKGNLLQLYGWSISVNKRDEKHMISLARKEDTILTLQEECNTLRDNLNMKTIEGRHLSDMIQTTREENDHLTEEVKRLTSDSLLAHEKEQILYQMLIEERKKNSLTHKKYSASIDNFRSDVRQLQDNVSHYLIKKSPCDQSVQTTTLDKKDIGTTTANIIKPSPNIPQPFEVPNSTTNPPDQFARKVCHTNWQGPLTYSQVVAKNLKETCKTNNSSQTDPDDKEDRVIKEQPVSIFHDKFAEDFSVTIKVKKQVCDILPEGVLYQEPDISAQSQESTILDGNVLAKLFQEPKQPELKPTAKDSAVLTGGVLPRLFGEFAREPENNLTQLKKHIPRHLFTPKTLKMLLKLHNQLSSCDVVNSDPLDGCSLPMLFQGEEWDSGVESCSSEDDQNREHSNITGENQRMYAQYRANGQLRRRNGFKRQMQ